MIPIILLALPFFVVLTRVRLYYARLGLILAYTSFTLPFCSLTMIGFFRSIPEELDESALIDGYSRMGAFSRNIMPLTLPGQVATGIFALIYNCNEYLMAVVLTSSGRTRMLTVLIGSKIGQYNVIWNELMADHHGSLRAARGDLHPVAALFPPGHHQRRPQDLR